jgi:hypothetical protein
MMSSVIDRRLGGHLHDVLAAVLLRQAFVARNVDLSLLFHAPRDSQAPHACN